MVTERERVKDREPRHHDVTAPVTLRLASSRAITSEVGAMLRLAIPLAGAQVAMVAMSATDAAFLGRLGPISLAAGGLAASIHATVQLVAAGALTVIAPLAAEARARADHARVAAIARHGLAAAILLGTVGALLVQYAGSALRVLDEPNEIVTVADPFLRAVAWSTPFALASAVLRHMLTAAGRPRIVTITAVGGAALNAVLDFVLMRGGIGLPAMGAAGVGAATTIVNVAMCVVLAVATGRVVTSRAVLRLRFDGRLVRDLIELGLPAAAMIGAEVAVFQLAGVAIARYGASSLAAHQIGLTVATMSFVVPIGIAQAAAVRVAEARVIGGDAASRRTGLVAIALAVSFMVVAGIVLWAIPDPLTRGFVRGDTVAMEALFEKARAVLAVAAVFQVFDGAQVVAAGSLRGLRDTRLPAVVGVGAYGVVAPLVAWLAAAPLGLGVVGIWIGLASGLAVVAVALTIRFLTLTSRLAAAVP